MWLFVLFIVVPLVEIGLFIQVGGWLTLWPTLGIVVLTAAIGAWLARWQGLHTLNELQRSVDELRDPATPMAHGAMILFAGALLLTPGFLTDGIGFLLLVPAVRSALLRQLITHGHRVHLHRQRGAPPHPHGDGPAHASRRGPKRPGPADIIEGEYEDATQARPSDRREGRSGWTRPPDD